MRKLDLRAAGNVLLWGGLGLIAIGGIVAYIFAKRVAPATQNGQGAVFLLETVKKKTDYGLFEDRLVENFNWLFFTLWAAPSAAIGFLMSCTGVALKSADRSDQSNAAPASPPRPEAATTVAPADAQSDTKPREETTWYGRPEA